jgi:hypothetical protein
LAYRLGGFLKTHQSAALIQAHRHLRRHQLADAAAFDASTSMSHHSASVIWDPRCVIAPPHVPSSHRASYLRALSRWNIGELAP